MEGILSGYQLKYRKLFCATYCDDFLIQNLVIVLQNVSPSRRVLGLFYSSNHPETLLKQHIPCKGIFTHKYMFPNNLFE